jgi:hypothetical protein
MTRHPDGFGIATRVDGTLRVERFAPGDRKAFRKALKVADASGHEYAAHWRFATSGPVDAAHAHPYTYIDPIEGTVAVSHNGIIDIKHDRKRESDTEVFVRDVLAALPSGWWRDAAQRYLVAGAIGYSKLVVMTAAETVVINEGLGKVDGGIWYSSDHRPSKWTKGWRPAQPVRVPAAAHKSASEAYKVLTGQAPATPSPTLPLALGEVTGDDAYVPDRSAGTFDVDMLTEDGYRVAPLVPISLATEHVYRAAGRCEHCGRLADIWVVDGRAYADLEHDAEPIGALVAV